MSKAGSDYVGPTFLGIGPPKCATTWLDEVLRKHPEISFPSHQKEVFYFDRFHKRGDAWYLNLFTDIKEKKAAGEISTSYILEQETLSRINDFNPKMKIIILLRHPVDRMISNYRMFVENGRTTLDFEGALEAQPIIKDYSRYSVLLQQVELLFPKNQIFIGISEELLLNERTMAEFLEKLLDFLEVDSKQPDRLIQTKEVRKSMGAPRSLWLVKKAKAIRSSLKRRNLEWIVSALNKVGIGRQLFLKNAPPTKIDDTSRARLTSEFSTDIQAVEQFLGRSIEAWH